MKRTVLLSLAIGCCFFTALKAQQKTGTKAKSTSVKKVDSTAALSDSARTKHKPPVTVTLGHSDLSGGAVSKAAFDSLMREGLFASDSTGVVGEVYDFVFIYKERNLYEDSLGNYYQAFDLLSDYCKGNKLTRQMDNPKNLLSDRTKPGDTAMFDYIGVGFPDGPRMGRPMKFVLTR